MFLVAVKESEQEARRYSTTEQWASWLSVEWTKCMAGFVGRDPVRNRTIDRTLTTIFIYCRITLANNYY